MEIILAEHAGCCFGVRRAIERAHEETRRRGKLYSLGPLIHNRQVVEALREAGLEPVDSISQVPPGEAVLLRTHGVGPSVQEEAAQRGLHVIDATCPFVARAQQEAARLQQAGYQVLVLGEPDHPEAQAIREHTGGAATIVETPQDLQDLALSRRLAVVCQTTQRIDALRALVSALLPRVSELVVANTICDATTQRQEAAVRMARQVDVAIVIGGRHSANTTRLTQVCADAGVPTYHVESSEEIQCEWLQGARRVGITAGASTPAEAIEAAVERVRECARILESADGGVTSPPVGSDGIQ